MAAFERILWRLVVILLIIGCVLSVWAALGGRLTPMQVKMLASSYGVAVYAGMGLCCAAVVRRQPTSIGARIGMFVAAAGGAVFLMGIWTEIARYDWWWKLFGATFVESLAACVASALLLCALDDKFRMVRAITRTSIYLWATLITVGVFLEIQSPLLWRVVGVSGTLGFFGALAMPVLAKLSKRD